MVATQKDQALSPLTGAILESISDGVFTVDLHWNITSFNRAAEENTGIPRKEAIGGSAPKSSNQACAKPSVPSRVRCEPKADYQQVRVHYRRGGGPHPGQRLYRRAPRRDRDSHRRRRDVPRSERDRGAAERAGRTLPCRRPHQPQSGDAPGVRPPARPGVQLDYCPHPG